MEKEKIESFKKHIKSILKSVLIEYPPKRLGGRNSDWLDVFILELAKSGAISGGIRPCCMKWCEQEQPCGYGANISSKERDKELQALIDAL